MLLKTIVVEDWMMGQRRCNGTLRRYYYHPGGQTFVSKEQVLAFLAEKRRFQHPEGLGKREVIRRKIKSATYSPVVKRGRIFEAVAKDQANLNYSFDGYSMAWCRDLAAWIVWPEYITSATSRTIVARIEADGWDCVAHESTRSMFTRTTSDLILYYGGAKLLVTKCDLPHAKRIALRFISAWLADSD